MQITLGIIRIKYKTTEITLGVTIKFSREFMRKAMLYIRKGSHHVRKAWCGGHKTLHGDCKRQEKTTDLHIYLVFSKSFSLLLRHIGKKDRTK